MKILFILGTRPEAIKLSPLVLELRKYPSEILVCGTGQHKDLLGKALATFGVEHR
jgi:UDP-N-acetylglucosamine 2-epimerase (non-hydrolysing)